MSFLDNVQLAYACPLRWEKLVGGDRQRYCAQCERHVHNLSAMTRPEAERLLASESTPICVRVEVDAHGRAVHRPGLAAVVAVSLLAACGADGADSALDSGSSHADSAGALMVDDAPGTAAGAAHTPTTIPEADQGSRVVHAEAGVGGDTAGARGGGARPDVDKPDTEVVGRIRPLMGRPAVRLGEPLAVMGVPPVTPRDR